MINFLVSYCLSNFKKSTAIMILKLSEKNKDFFVQVYDVVRLIPKGRVTSYGAIANYLGTKSGARMVGWAMNAAHVLPDVPAHRVVNRNGLLTGKMHFEDANEMERLLENEGILIEKDQVKDFKLLFWDPMTELSLK
jgi:methylated-DNA-protein-cysteine methyltransferase-like protein